MKFSACIVAAFAAIAAAYTPPDTSKPPSGNPISRPGLLELVPVGQPYTITWQPSTPGKVSLLLLRGPSNNVKYLATIADSVTNTGTYIWTPPTSLVGEESGYGIQIVVEGTGQYQYSTQFGIKNDKYVPEPSDKYPTAEPTDKYPTAKPTDKYPTAKPSDYPTGGSSSSSSSSSSSYTLVPISTATITVCASTVSACPPTKTPVTPSGTGPATVQPTVQPTYSASPKPTTPPPFDGAAGRNGVAIGGLVAAAVVMFALLAGRASRANVQANCQKLTSTEEDSLVQWMREVSLPESKSYETWRIYYFLPELNLLWEKNGFEDSLHVI
ncbi:hypothetical protein ACO22_00237 [Paracoccidioides brasiliensis]|uniref:Yeast cell wall synthesis Kre9/Knh1-like N-terminal domain-containing protein n=1 Tax=Paracoccidioides brasiliensis TaxID=121759 RepID=A0A1D2JQ42_PARBR|nr:hypothetical protein ACO22_00237 [Paracoccidioides brasiliensis]